MLFSTQHYVRNNIKEYDEHTHSTLKNDVNNDALTYTRTARSCYEANMRERID